MGGLGDVFSKRLKDTTPPTVQISISNLNLGGIPAPRSTASTMDSVVQAKSSGEDASCEAEPTSSSSPSMMPTSESTGADNNVSSTPPEEPCKKNKTRHRRRRGQYVCEKKTACLKDADRPSGSEQTVSTDEKSADKTSAETSSGDRTISASSGTTSAGGPEAREWTLSEDHQLRGMKEDKRQPSWKEVADALHREKRDVKARWKTIRNQPRADADETSSLEEQPKAVVKSTKTKNKKKEKKMQGDYSSSSDDNLTYGPGSTHRHDARYLHQHVYKGLYPRTISPTPCEAFNSDDCAVLAAVDSKYKHGRWMEMQANFLNVTGRLVPLWMIRDRCERAEKEEREKGQRATVGKWLKAVDQEGLGDPDV